jgi:hypothetical protein
VRQDKCALTGGASPHLILLSGDIGGEANPLH